MDSKRVTLSKPGFWVWSQSCVLSSGLVLLCSTPQVQMLVGGIFGAYSS